MRRSSNRKSGGALYFLKEGLSSIFVHKLMSFAAVTVIAACMLITGIFSLVAYNIDMLVESLASQSEIYVYVDETMSRSEALALESQIRSLDNVARLEFISKEQAFQNYLDELGEDAYIMEDLEADNPLRDGYRIAMKDVSMHEDTVKKLESLPGIAASNSEKEVSDKLMQIRKVVKLIAYTLIGLLGAVSVFIISNTVRLAMFARRDEIAVMKMVGATNHFIRTPFVIEGVALGIGGAVLAFFTQWGVYGYIVKELEAGTAIFDMQPFTVFVRPLAMWLLAAGVVIGGVGSGITIRRFLRV
ncbi:MAG: permease-like cell division protein FtsX [Clostridia bacterium]|nr:permease-like cell division protein FtsX [Clostridia bacterium]